MAVVIRGTSGADFLQASRLEPSTVLGLDGNDILSSNLTNKTHTLDAGAGDDQIIFNTWSKQVLGRSGDDRINGSIGSDAVINGGSGNDQIRVNNADPDSRGWRVLGGSGDDEIQYSQSSGTSSIRDVLISGGKGNDRILITRLNLLDRIKVSGGAGRDVITVVEPPKAPSTRIDGGKGRDTLVLSNRDVAIRGNSDRAVVFYPEDSSGISARLVLTNVERIILGGESFGEQIFL